MTKELERLNPANTLTAERVDLVRNTVARGASDDELAMFLTLADRYNLDPFAKEIVCGVALDERGDRKTDKHGNPYAPIIMVGRDGLLKIANSRDDYRGMVSDVVCEKDDFRITRSPEHPDGFPDHSYGSEDRGRPVGAYALVLREGRSPGFFFAKWAEYGEPNVRLANGTMAKWSPWYKYPSAMILKVAQSVALKQAYSVSGVVAEEELDAGRAIEEEGAEGTIQARRPLHTPQLGPHGVVKRAPARELQPTPAETPAEPEPEPEPPAPAAAAEKPPEKSQATIDEEAEIERLRKIAEEAE